MYVCMTVFPGSKFFLLLAKTSDGLNYFCFIKLLCVLSPFSCVQLFATPWTHQAPLSMDFGLPFSSPGYFLNPGIKPESPALQAYSLPSEPPDKPSQAGASIQMKESGEL